MGRAKVIFVIFAVILVAGLIGGALVPDEDIESSIYAPRDGGQEVFHARLADPELYGEDGVYADTFEISGGLYEFDFVPNGSSPENLTIMLRDEEGGNPEYREDFALEGTRHEAILGEYYTWEYLGQSQLSMPDAATIYITIDPNGSTQGSVSVYLYEE